ncbi:retrovirus-related pol polyprotein from transposon TNT 1-94 [Tanacetum coccineum]
MHNNIMAAGSSPYIPSTIVIQAVPATENSPAVPEHTTVETILNMSPANKAYFKSEKEAIHMILTRIGDEIYFTVDACNTAHEIWEAIERLQQEWSRFVTIVKQQHKLDEVSYHKFFDILKQYQKEVNELRAERIAKSHATTRHKGKEIAKQITPPSESPSDEDSEPEQAQKDKEMQKNLALIAKYFKKLYKPTNNNLRTSSNTRNKNVDTTPRYKNDNQSGQFRNQRTMTVARARETVGGQVMQQSGIQCFNCKEFGHFAKECRKPKRVKDSTYHKEKMLLCKQAEKGVQLQAEQFDWIADTDEEIDEQELEVHYSYMAKIQEVHNADSGTDSEPLEQVQYDTGYDVFANETVDSNVILDSPDMCDNDIQNDQNDVECDDERVALANLIANLKLDVDENKNIQKQLKKANAPLTQELKECKSALEETSRTLGESNSIRDSCLVALQNKQTEFERYKAFNDHTVDYEKLERKLNETLGLLAQKDIDIKEGLKVKAYEIIVVKEKHDELVKHSLLTKSHYEGLVKEKTKVITNLKLKEEKDIDKMISIENQLKFLNEIVYKRCQSIQTIHMLAPKCPTFNGRPTFANPMYPKKAQYEKPCLFDISHDQSDPANKLVPDREKTLTLERESQEKLNKDLVKPYDYTKELVDQAWVKHSRDHFRSPTAKDIEILIKTCLMPLALKTQNDSFAFVHELKKEMHADLKYVESLEKEINELESDKAEFSNMYDMLFFSKLEKHSIPLELALQQCQEQMKNDTVCKEKASKVFLKEREQYFEIQDLKAQLQDKNIAISKLKKLIEKCKGKSMETKFDKPSVVRQPNAQRIPKLSVLGKPAPFSGSLKKKSFSQTKLVPKTNVSEGLSKPVTTQILPQTATQAVRNTNMIKPGMYRIDTRTTQTRAPQLPQTSRNTNLCVSTSTGVIHSTNVSRPQLRSTQIKDKVLPNTSQVKFKKTEVEDHPRISKMTTSTPICLTAKALPTQAWLWNRRLSHLYFDYINLLLKKDIMIGLPKLKYVKDQLCSFCEVSKAKKKFIQDKDYSKFKRTVKFASYGLMWSNAAIATACYTQNRSIIIPTHEKMAYHIINDIKPSIKHLYIFGCTCYLTRDGENLDKMKEKGDPCILVGYSTESKGYRVYNKRTRLIVESIHLRFDKIKEMSETSVVDDTSDLVPQQQKVSDYDNSGPVPQLKNVSPLADTTVPSQQELDLLFGPLYDEFFNIGTSSVNNSSSLTDNSKQQDTPPTTNIQSSTEPTNPTNVNTEENNYNQAEDTQFHQDEFINPFYTPIREITESSSRNIDNSNMHTFYQPHDSEYRWTKDHPLEQVHGNPSKPVQTR